MQSTTTASRTRPAGLLRMLPLVVVAIVIGILGMHALTASHAMAMDSAGHSSAAAATTGNPSPAKAEGVDLIGTVSILSDTTGPAVVDAGDGSGHGMGTMMMLCAAMLVSAGALLLALFAWRRSPRVWARLTTYAVRSGPPTWITNTGPPSAWEFSVIRC